MEIWTLIGVDVAICTDYGARVEMERQPDGTWRVVRVLWDLPAPEGP